MNPESRDFYTNIQEYIYQLIGKKEISLKLLNVFIRAEIPMQTFITAVKLYKIILSKALAENENVFLCKKNKSLFVDKSAFIEDTNYKISTKLIHNPYSTFVSCCIISSKYYKDIAYNNDSWGTITCLTGYQINKIERETLGVLDYKVNSDGDKNIMRDINNVVRSYGFETIEVEPSEKVLNFKEILRKFFCLVDKN